LLRATHANGISGSVIVKKESERLEWAHKKMGIHKQGCKKKECVLCVFVCVWKREGEIEIERDRAREREGVYNVCGCVCVFVCDGGRVKKSQEKSNVTTWNSLMLCFSFQGTFINV